LINFRGVIDPAETPWKFEIAIAGEQLLLKGKSHKNISETDIPITYFYFTEKCVQF
jgi:hypothetical protein